MIASTPIALERTGHIYRVQGSIHAEISASIGELVRIRVGDGTFIPAEVIGFDNDRAQLMPMVTDHQFNKGDLVVSSGNSMRIPVGEQLLGRVVDASGIPIDQRGHLKTDCKVSLQLRPPTPLDREKISQTFETGIKAIDSMLTIGTGQRVGIFAGSGVGKSTLLGNIARNAVADVNVVALIGERGREVKPFIQDCLGAEGMKKSIVIVSTSDQSPLCRVRAVETAIAMANWFREQHSRVLLMMDSLTRFANAQKELGLMLGEPPTSRGFPPSVFQRMAAILEQLGNSSKGSITGLITVLVDGDDMNEPVADAARSILDGHIVLRREIAQKNHYPAIDILESVSRLANELTTEQQQLDASIVRSTIALYQEVELLVQLGSYEKGSNPATDGAIECMPRINQFLQQGRESSNHNSTVRALHQLADICRLKTGTGGQ